MLGVLLLLGTLLVNYKADAQNTTQVEAVCQDPKTAAACPDTNPELCGLLDPPTTSSPLQVDPKCTDVKFNLISDACPQKCLKCCNDPKYQCENNPTTPVNCSQIQQEGGCSTNDTAFLSILQKECPQSCGMCGAPGTCQDTDMKLCHDLGVIMCRDKDHYLIMEDKCPKLCNTCDKVTTPVGGATTTTPAVPGGVTTAVATTAAPATGCNDLANNCAANVGLCTNAAYRDLMSSKCKKTCNLCSVGGEAVNPPASCTNASPSCPTWVSNGFCSNAAYTAAQKKMYCALSCNQC